MKQGLETGKILQNGIYRIEKVLGQGSFGITYLATAKFTTQGNLGTMEVNTQVAIKEFFMNEVNSRGIDGSYVDGSSGNVFTNYRKKFKKEAENLSKLSHPNIVKVFDVFNENNTTYYVMEFLEGINLDEYIRKNEFLSENETINIIKEIGAALAYMHSQKMLHLDVKPQNIMRKSDGSYYLIDFGLSKQFTEDGEPESSTSIGLGTPGYAPIEQSEYKQDGTFPSTLDVYALGATMFKMLTGQRPPEATNILNEGFPSGELSDLGISNHTIASVEKAMKSIKKERYQNVIAFLKELENNEIEDVTIVDTPIMTKAEPTPHHKSTPKYKTKSDSSKKHKWRWYIVSAIIVAGSIMIIQKIINPDIPSKPLIMSPHNINTIDKQTPLHVTNMAWDSPLGNASYTGSVEPDSVYGSTKLIPHGKGIARITEGQYSGNVYDGEFEMGRMHGETIYTQKNGDTFVGTFKNNKYYHGRYTINSSGEYFEGFFENGQPSNGDWFYKNGKKI